MNTPINSTPVGTTPVDSPIDPALITAAIAEAQPERSKAELRAEVEGYYDQLDYIVQEHGMPDLGSKVAQGVESMKADIGELSWKIALAKHEERRGAEAPKAEAPADTPANTPDAAQQTTQQ